MLNHKIGYVASNGVNDESPQKDIMITIGSATLCGRASDKNKH